ncbi:MAG: cation transporter [Lachnospiraceae bacterium]|nr:cation transporter [Lachnospiraceae bacterium]
MREFLVKKFIKNYEQIDDSKVREQYGVLSSIVGIFCNIILFVLKFIIGTMANSIAIISDGFNNLSDCASCIVTLFGYKMAAKPADKDHPFGHGRMEYLTSLVIAVVILFVGVELLKGSWAKIWQPEQVEFSVVAVCSVVISVLIKVWMGFFNRNLGKKINSTVMLATSKDSFNDVLATSATLIALVAALFTDAPIDGIIGIVVSVFILISGYGIIKETVDQLLGQPADPNLVNDIKNMVEETDVAIGMHDLIIHSYGPGKLIGSVHVEVDGKGDIMEIHDAIDELERNIYDELNVMITIHMDPVETDNEEINKCKALLEKILCEIDSNLSMHDFRIVSGPSHTNLIFDIVIPYECKLSEKFIKEEIDRRLKNCDKAYYTVITFDKNFC